MKWNDESTARLKELVFADKSNKEIAQAMEIDINDVYNKRSQLGITKDKVKINSAATDEVPAVDQKVKDRSVDEIFEEIHKVEQARIAAYKKIDRCVKRLTELKFELIIADNKLKVSSLKEVK